MFSEIKQFVIVAVDEDMISPPWKIAVTQLERTRGKKEIMEESLGLFDAALKYLGANPLASAQPNTKRIHFSFPRLISREYGN